MRVEMVNIEVYGNRDDSMEVLACEFPIGSRRYTLLRNYYFRLKEGMPMENIIHLLRAYVVMEYEIYWRKTNHKRVVHASI